MDALISLCCGGVEEERKGGAFLEPSEKKMQEQGARVVARIHSVEEQISIMGKARPVERGAICSKPICTDAAMGFKPVSYPKTAAERQFIEGALNNNFLFTGLEEGELGQFIDAMQKVEVTAGTLIIQQGGIGDFFYIVEDGTVSFTDDGKEVGLAKKGGSFGELALLYDAPRAVSCFAKTAVSMWKVDQNTFRYLVVKNAHGQNEKTKELLKKIEVFDGLDEPSLTSFAEALTPVTWEANSRVMQKGEEGNTFYIVESGRVKVHDIGLGDSQFEDRILGPGEWFGERALVTGEPRAANVTAVEKVITLAIDRETFECKVGPVKDAFNVEMKRRFLQSIPVFSESGLSGPEIKQLAKLVEEVCFLKGTALTQTGIETKPTLYIIRHGRVLVYNSNHETLNQLNSGDYFGDKALLREPGHVSASSAICEGNVTAWILSKDSVESVIGDASRLAQPKRFVRSSKVTNLSLANLSKVRMIGMGAFGEVWMVKDETNRKSSGYALKVINKLKLLDSKQEHGVIREKEFLSMLQHPFILQSVSSFQDEINLYLLLPIIPGGELFSVLQKQKGSGLKPKQAAFYAACIVEALGHFHQRSICYRDLKLENVLIDELGYCKIVDLGFAKVVTNKTYTLVGTPEYLAPEIILSKGHDKAVDFWSYGVLVYELLVGRSPFFMPRSSQMDMFKRIVQSKYTIPSRVGNEARDLISELLVRTPSARLGNRCKGYLEVKADPWFRNNGIDFRFLTLKQSTAPWIPTIKDSMDASHFDKFNPPPSSGRRLTDDEQAVFKEF